MIVRAVNIEEGLLLLQVCAKSALVTRKEPYNTRKEP